MIVETMSDSEIAMQLAYDYPEVIYKASRKSEVINKFRRQIIKGGKFPMSSAPITIRTSRRNTWIVIYRAYKKRDKNYKIEQETTFICVGQFTKGMYAFMRSDVYDRDGQRKESGISIFAPHFFRRYKQRFDVAKTGIDLIGQYFIKNYNLYRDNQFAEEHGESISGRRIFATSEEGVALGIMKSESVMLFRTYISYEMMKGKQIPEFMDREIRREEYMKHQLLGHSVPMNNQEFAMHLEFTIRDGWTTKQAYLIPEFYEPLRNISEDLCLDKNGELDPKSRKLAEARTINLAQAMEKNFQIGFFHKNVLTLNQWGTQKPKVNEQANQTQHTLKIVFINK